MTDAEAKALLYEMRYQPSPRMAEAVRHALQSIEDRERLAGAAAYALRILPLEYADWRAALEQSVEAARRHVRGEE